MEILHLERGRTRCVIVPEAGGRLHQLELFDGREWIPLLHSAEDPRDACDASTLSGSFAMLPWPNRIAGGVFMFDGQAYELRRNHRGHAIHGLGFDRPWHLESKTRDSCRLTIDIGDPWPFGGRAIQEFQLLDDVLVQRIELHATDRAFPAGGWLASVVPPRRSRWRRALGLRSRRTVVRNGR
jgi:aldose 1-epimerase